MRDISASLSSPAVTPLTVQSPPRGARSAHGPARSAAVSAPSDASECGTHEGLLGKASHAEKGTKPAGKGARVWARGGRCLPPFIPTRGPRLRREHSLPPNPSLGRHPIGGHPSPVTKHRSHLSGSRQISPTRLPSCSRVRGAGETP